MGGGVAQPLQVLPRASPASRAAASRRSGRLGLGVGVDVAELAAEADVQPRVAAGEVLLGVAPEALLGAPLDRLGDRACRRCRGRRPTSGPVVGPRAASCRCHDGSPWAGPGERVPLAVLAVPPGCVYACSVAGCRSAAGASRWPAGAPRGGARTAWSCLGSRPALRRGRRPGWARRRASLGQPLQCLEHRPRRRRARPPGAGSPAAAGAGWPCPRGAAPGSSPSAGRSAHLAQAIRWGHWSKKS